MGVGAGIRTEKGKFVGMTLERVHGRNINKVICTERFNDVTYIFDMLYGVFTALERAQGALGESLCFFSAPTPFDPENRQTKNPTHMSLPATWWLSFTLDVCLFPLISESSCSCLSSVQHNLLFLSSLSPDVFLMLMLCLPF
jgi:hypothetical protein